MQTDTTYRHGADLASPARFWPGLGWGIVATLAMSVPMIAGVLTGALPMPQPIPAAIVGSLFGEFLPQPGIMGLAVASHLAYGGVAGGVLALLTRPVTVGKGIAWGVILWILMGMLWLPYLGWGLFGMGISLQVAAATLVLHLIYGATLGWLVDRGA